MCASPASGPPTPDGVQEDAWLTPAEAEAIVDERIELFGLGALPKVSVVERADGTWHVRWSGLESIVAPMRRQAWHAWLEANVGSLDAGDLETTES
jgi:hypothetical protein